MHLHSLIAVIIALPLRSASASPLPDFSKEISQAIMGNICQMVEDISRFRCKGEDDAGPIQNPTRIYGNHEGLKSRYEDGIGTLVSTDDRFKFENKDECWTDLYWVEEVKNTTDWKLEAKNDCGGNSSECFAGIDNGVETCNEWSLGVETGAELGLKAKIFDAKLTAKLTATKGGSDCEKIGTNLRCSWKDQGCHAIWTRTTGTIDYGYIRRRCNKGGEGDKTYWSMDWTLSEKADSVELGCKASCDAETYPA